MHISTINIPRYKHPAKLIISSSKMALIKCKECKSEVSSKAETCPKCGVRVAAKPMGCGSKIVGILLMVVATYYVLDLFSSNTKNDNSSI